MRTLSLIDNQSCEIELQHPDSDIPQHVVVSLYHVRAAEDLRVSFDFKRDGWKVERSGWDKQSEQPTWDEVSFVKAFAEEPESK